MIAFTFRIVWWSFHCETRRCSTPKMYLFTLPNSSLSLSLTGQCFRTIISFFARQLYFYLFWIEMLTYSIWAICIRHEVGRRRCHCVYYFQIHTRHK